MNAHLRGFNTTINTQPMMKYFATALAICFFQLLSAQQPAQYSLYMLNPLGWNPAYAGLDNSLSITAVHRKQWTALAGSPATQNVSAHLPLFFAKGGFGINLENDAFGAERWTTAVLAYSYQRELGAGILSLGVGGGLLQRELDGSKLRTPDGSYTEPGNPNHNDPLLPLSAETAMTPTLHAGVYYAGERLEGGFSVRNINEGQATFSTLTLSLKRNYNFSLGAHFDLNRVLSLHPYALLRSDLVQTQLDFSLILRYNDNIFAGTSFRGYNVNSRDAVAILAGFKLSEKLTFAYAYDLTLSNLNTVSNGSHEIMLNFNLNKPIGQGKLPPIIYNPRSL